MKVSFCHVIDHGSDSQRAKRVSPPVEGARGGGGDVDVGLHPARGRQGPRPAHAAGSADAPARTRAANLAPQAG